MSQSTTQKIGFNGERRMGTHFSKREHPGVVWSVEALRVKQLPPEQMIGKLRRVDEQRLKVLLVISMEPSRSCCHRILTLVLLSQHLWSQSGFLSLIPHNLRYSWAGIQRAHPKAEISIPNGAYDHVEENLRSGSAGPHCVAKHCAGPKA